MFATCPEPLLANPRASGAGCLSFLEGLARWCHPVPPFRTQNVPTCWAVQFVSLQFLSLVDLVIWGTKRSTTRSRNHLIMKWNVINYEMFNCAIDSFLLFFLFPAENRTYIKPTIMYWRNHLLLKSVWWPLFEDYIVPEKCPFQPLMPSVLCEEQDL